MLLVFILFLKMDKYFNSLLQKQVLENMIDMLSLSSCF